MTEQVDTIASRDLVLSLLDAYIRQTARHVVEHQKLSVPVEPGHWRWGDHKDAYTIMSEPEKRDSEARHAEQARKCLERLELAQTTRRRVAEGEHI